MLEFIQSQFLFYISIALVLFAPGYSLLFAIFGKKWLFSSLDAFIVSFGLSIISIDFIMLVMGRLGAHINRWSLIFFIALFIIACGIVFLLRLNNRKEIENNIHFPNFSKMQFIAIIALLFLTIFIKTAYLKNTILPTSTDLGHHMYWAKTISLTGEIPEYAKVNIDLKTDKLTAPEPIADFIVGEHLIFAAINLISGISFISYFPALILFLIHLMSLLTTFILARTLFREYPNTNTISILTLFFIGPLYALASPQVKFVSGGVIGNTIGNFFIPLSIYFFLRAFTEKSSTMLAFAFFTSLGLAYTHHLSMFVFIFTFAFFGLFFIILNFKKIKEHFQDWIKLLFKIAPLAILVLGTFFIILIYTPTYLNTKAIDTAVGAPSKATREGLTFNQLSDASGSIRMALGLFGIALLLYTKKRKNYTSTLLLGWSISLVAISLKPSLFYVNIPSERIANYIIAPISIIGGFAFVYFFDLLKNYKDKKQYLNPNFILATFLLLITFLIMNGLRENTATLNTDQDIKATLETYHASRFLAQKTTTRDIILKDHNYLAADSWMKLYFMRGYTYPLSRGYFKRYEDETKAREQCTNIMISTPNTPEAKKCFSETRTNFIMLNPKFDSMQFIKLKNFWKIYSAEGIAIFYKKN